MESMGEEMNRWGVSLIGFSIAFFSLFLGVNASITGDGWGLIFSLIMAFGAVSTTMGLNAFIRYRESVRRLQPRTDEIRASYSDPERGTTPAVPLDINNPPMWTKCNICGVYLRDHGTEDHPWVELDIEAQQRRDWKDYDCFELDDEPEVRETEQERRDRTELKKRIEKNRQKNMMGKPHVHRQVSGRPCVQCEAKRRGH